MVINFKFTRFIVFAFAVIYLFAACGNDDQKLKRKPLKPKKTINVEKDTVITENYVIYRTPGTSEQMRQMKKFISTFNSKVVYGLKEIDSTLTDKSLVLGVLLSDLSYCNAFGKRKESKLILDKVKFIQSRLNIIDSTYLKLPKDKSLPTEIEFMSNTAYSAAILNLREQKMWTELTKVKLGAWVQNMHISLSVRSNVKKKNELLDFLSSQKIVTENLLYSLIEEGDNKVIDFFSDKLTRIIELYDQLAIETKNITIEKTGEIYILKGTRTMSKDIQLYDEIATIVEQLRNEIGNYGKK